MNYYGIILLVVLIAGVLLTAWGWKILSVSKKIRQWPVVEGIIKVSELSSAADDLLPDIRFEYVVAGETYLQEFVFPDDMDAMPELAKSYYIKYPVGSKVSVYYNPDDLQEAMLEPNMRGDWMVISLGIVVTVASFLALLTAI